MILDHTRSRRALTRRVLLLVLTPGVVALGSLAMLRPVSKAQAAPPKAQAASVGVAGGSSVTLLDRSRRLSHHLRAARFAMLVSGPAKRPILLSSSDLTIDGTPLLAGMTDADRPGGPWWSAVGASLSSPVYDTTAVHAENHAGADTNNVSFAFRLPGDAQDVTVQYELPQSVRSSSDGFWPTKLQENAQKTEAQLFAKTNGLRVLTAAFPPALKTTSLRVGIASGTWKTAATDTRDTLSEPAGFMSDSDNHRKFIFGPPFDISSVATKSSVVLTISTDSTDDLRVIAVTTQGQTVLPDQIGGNSIGSLDQITAHFALPLAQIKAIRVETRPFVWVEFKDVALQPAK